VAAGSFLGSFGAFGSLGAAVGVPSPVGLPGGAVGFAFGGLVVGLPLGGVFAFGGFGFFGLALPFGVVGVRGSGIVVVGWPGLDV